MDYMRFFAEISFIILVSFGCRKKYVCDCSTVWTYRYNNNNGGGTNSVTFKGTKPAYSEKLTKKQAKASCEHQRQAIESSFTNWYTYNQASPLKEGESNKNGVRCHSRVKYGKVSGYPVS